MNIKNQWIIKNKHLVLLDNGIYKISEAFGIYNYIDKEEARLLIINNNNNVKIPDDVTDDNKIELSNLHFHELTDRIYMINDILDRYVIEHPAANYKEIYDKLNSVVITLMEVYQMSVNLEEYTEDNTLVVKYIYK